MLAGDSIINYRTVASFAHDEIIISEYDNYLEGPLSRGVKKAHIIGVSFGFSQFVQNAVFSLLYYAGAEFNYHDNSTSGEDIFKAMFAMMFGAFAAGQAN